MELSPIIRQLQTIFTERQLSAPFEELAELSRFANNHSFVVNILGGHLVGKATPVNILTGRELIPVDALALENARILVKSGEKERILITYANGTTADQASARVKWDALLASGVEIRDATIEIEDEWIEEHTVSLAIQPSLDREEVTENNLTRQVPPSEAILFVISATTPVSLTEKNILEQLQTQGIAPQLAVVLTRLDHVVEREHAALLEHIAGRLRRIAPGMLLISDGSLHAAIETWAAQPHRLQLKENSIRRRLILLIDHAMMQWIGKKMELEQKDEERRKELLKIRFQTEQKRMYWEDIRIATGKKANQCRELIRNSLDKARDSTISRLKYDLAHTGNPKQWWEKDLPFKIKAETESLISNMERTIDSRVLNDISWIQNQVRSFFAGNLQMSVPGASLQAEDYETRPPSEEISDINRSKYTMMLVTGGVTASLYVLRIVTFGWGALVGAAGSVLTQEIMNRKLKEQQDALTKSLETGIARHYDKILTEASGKVVLLYDGLLEEIRKEEQEWANKQEGLLQKQEERHDPALVSVTDLINQLETIKAQL